VPTFAALIRAINLGAKNKVAMPALKASLGELGYEDVTTYVQSGNVVFRTPGAAKAEHVASSVERRIAMDFGIDAAVLVRTAAELRKIAAANPFLKDERDPVKLHVVFLDGKPPAKARAELDPERSPPDRFHVHGREIYLHLPNGSARSKMTIDYFERHLGVRATGRNWKTVEKLVELAGG
jgi:uncharacterized protein (DUF1697 family)